MEPTPYITTNSNNGAKDFAQRKHGRWLAVLGIVLFTGPIWGVLGTVIGMIRAFNTLAEDKVASAESLSQDIGITLVTTAVGITVGLLGAILILMALFATKNRENWFFWWSVVLSVFWGVAIFPYGLIAGLPIFILFIMKRDEFPKPTKA
jgi:biopolymer transport protein ExbB/TolQ